MTEAKVNPPRILLMGCGAVGGVLAGEMLRSGHDLTIIGHNEAITTAINRNGLQIKTPRAEYTLPTSAYLDLTSVDGSFDIVLLTMKATGVEQAVQDALPLLTPDGYVVPLQNGIVEDRVSEIAGQKRVIGGIVVWGARTLSSDPEYKYIPVRRMAIMLRKSIYDGIQWAVFEPNDEGLWSQLRLNIHSFMMTLFRQGAFQGATPREAFFVKCDSETTTQDDINLGIVNVLVGFAPLKPAEFVVVKISQKAGQAS